MTNDLLSRNKNTKLAVTLYMHIKKENTIKIIIRVQSIVLNDVLDILFIYSITY